MKIGKSILFSLGVLAAVLATASYADACSEILLNRTGDNVVSGRIMDFKFDFYSKFVPVQKDTKVEMRLSDGTSMGNFTTKYAFVAIDTKEKPIFSDGMNTEGLSIATLWLDDTVYQRAEENPGKRIVPCLYGVPYILGKCSTVADVRKMLDEIVVTDVNVKEVGGKAPMHLMFHDRYGKSLIVEYIDGKPNFYDFNVMTNDPDMPVHLAKLKEYQRNLAAIPPPTGFLDAQSVAMSKVINMDYNDNRFLLLCMQNNTVADSKTVKEAVTNCFRVLGRVNISKHEWENNKGGEGASTDMWTIVRDHKNLKIYFKSFANETIQMVDVKKLLAHPNQKIYLSSGDWFKEVTK